MVSIWSSSSRLGHCRLLLFNCTENIFRFQIFEIHPSCGQCEDTCSSSRMWLQRKLHKSQYMCLCQVKWLRLSLCSEGRWQVVRKSVSFLVVLIKHKISYFRCCCFVFLAGLLKQRLWYLNVGRIVLVEACASTGHPKKA